MTGDWRLGAACRGATGMFFPSHGVTAGAEVQAAKQICADCPVRVECLEWALQNLGGEHDCGVWGGTTPRERARLRRGRGWFRGAA